jgi:hypothetical protein
VRRCHIHISWVVEHHRVNGQELSLMIEFEYEMTYAETIEGPLGPTHRSPFGERICWLVTSATLRGPRISASLAMPGLDWIRLGSDGIRRPDLGLPRTCSSGAAG